MSESEESNLKVDDAFRINYMAQDLDDPVLLVERIYEIWRHWADFHLVIDYPYFEPISPPVIHYPEILPGTEEMEFVYPIHDFGNKFSTSKAQDMFKAGMSMCKLFYTIEKIFYLLIERLHTGGVEKDMEVQISIDGHLIAQRKAFESVINLEYNVVVTNFEAGEWGNRYLETVKRLAGRFGYPTQTPREIYKLNQINARTLRTNK